MGHLTFFSAMMILYLLLLCLVMLFCLLAIQLCQKVLPSSSIIRFLSDSGEILFVIMSWISRALWVNRELLYTLIGSIIPLDWYLRSVVPLFGNKDGSSTDTIPGPRISCVQPIRKLQPRSSADTRNRTDNRHDSLLVQGLQEFLQLEVPNEIQTRRREFEPRSGEEIWKRIISLQNPSLRQELEQFIQDEVPHEKYTRRRVRYLRRRGSLRKFYRKMRKADEALFKRYRDESVTKKTDHKIDTTQLYPCKYRPSPLHV